MNTPFNNREFEDPNKADPDKDLPEEFKAMSKSDIVRMLKEKDEAVKGLGTRMTEVLTEVTALRAESKKPDPPVKPSETPDPYAKPGEYTDHRLAEFQKAKIDPLINIYLSRAESEALAHVLSKPHMKDYADEVKQVIAGANPNAKVNPGFAEEVYKYVRGAHFDEIVEKTKKEKETAAEFTEVGTSAGTRRANSAPETLNDEQKRVAEGLGMSEDKYLLWQKKGNETGSEMVEKARATRR